MTMKPTILLIDLSALFRAAWHASEAAPTSVAYQGTLDAVKRCQNMVPNSLAAICCDGRGNWRRELSADYKAQREKQPEIMYQSLARVVARLRTEGHVIWACDGYEADDLIAGATAAARAAGHDVVIASHDKDLLQLVDEHVKALRTSTWNIIGAAEVTAKFGVEPESLGDWLALAGDKGDNIAGCPGVGQVRAAELLIKHGDLDGIWRKLAALTVGTGTGGVPFIETKTPAAAAIATPAIVQALWANRAAVELARKLVALRTDAPIRFDDLFTERKPAPEEVEAVFEEPIDRAKAQEERKETTMNTEISTRPTGAIATSGDEEWTVERIVAQTKKIQQCMHAVMIKDEHYGIIPGTTGKPTLLKSGAEKLCLMFRLCPEYEIVRVEQSPTLVAYTVRCVLTHIPSGNRVATGLGSCNSREKKYARPADRKCPACGKESIIKGKDDFGGGWLCWAKKGGCGAKFKDGDASVEKQDLGLADPSDLDNTILKMGCKRSLVAAILNGTAASDCFTQDLEDLNAKEAEYAPRSAA